MVGHGSFWLVFFPFTFRLKLPSSFSSRISISCVVSTSLHRNAISSAKSRSVTVSAGYLLHRFCCGVNPNSSSCPSSAFLVRSQTQWWTYFVHGCPPVTLRQVSQSSQSSHQIFWYAIGLQYFDYIYELSQRFLNHCMSGWVEAVQLLPFYEWSRSHPCYNKYVSEAD